MSREFAARDDFARSALPEHTLLPKSAQDHLRRAAHTGYSGSIERMAAIQLAEQEVRERFPERFA